MLVTQPPGVTTEWLSELRAGRAFSQTLALGATPAEYGHVQLFNPASSGVKIVVYTANAIGSSAMALYLSLYNTALTTDGGAGVNLLSGGSAGAGHIRSATDASQLGTALHFIQHAAGEHKYFEPRWLCQLGESEGVAVYASTVNVGMAVSFQWIELPQ